MVLSLAQNYQSELLMCGRFSLEQYPKTILEYLELGDVEFVAREQIYPTNDVHVIFHNKEGNEITLMNWGWERSFSKRPLINTRGQEAWYKKTWAEAMMQRRCIIPATAYYEWDENQPKGKRDRYKVTPTDDETFALGGLYEINQDTGEMFMSILTTQPNKKMASIHHRMPVILEKENFNQWLQSVEKEEVDKFMRPLSERLISLEIK